MAFGREVITALGYDFARGRLDLTPHPFTTRISLGDVRITTRVREDALTDALFITLHDHLPSEMIYERELLICRI